MNLQLYCEDPFSGGSGAFDGGKGNVIFLDACNSLLIAALLLPLILLQTTGGTTHSGS